VSRRLALVEALPEEIQEPLRGGWIGAHAAAKYLVPLARAKQTECVALVKALAARKVTSREMAALCEALASGNDAARAMVLRDPWLFLRAQAATKKAKGKERTPVEVLLGELGALGGIARRTRKRVGELAVQLGTAEREKVRRALELARTEASALFHRCNREFIDARPEAADGDPRAQ
jgi:hypothetical protein